VFGTAPVWLSPGWCVRHARDYNADLRAWIQTDQYMDPMADLGLSMSPHTRDRRSYGWNNPVTNTDQDGHDCSSGAGVSGGAACAEALNNYCETHKNDPRCGSGPVKAEHVEQNDQRVNDSAGQSTSYATNNPNDHSLAGSTVVTVNPSPSHQPSFVCGMGPYGCYPSIDTGGGPNSDQIWQIVAEAPYGLAYLSNRGAKMLGCDKRSTLGGDTLATIKRVQCDFLGGRHSPRLRRRCSDRPRSKERIHLGRRSSGMRRPAKSRLSGRKDYVVRLGNLLARSECSGR
jgi:hypothetical protein